MLTFALQTSLDLQIRSKCLDSITNVPKQWPDAAFLLYAEMSMYILKSFQLLGTVFQCGKPPRYSLEGKILKEFH